MNIPGFQAIYEIDYKVKNKKGTRTEKAIICSNSLREFFFGVSEDVMSDYVKYCLHGKLCSMKRVTKRKACKILLDLNDKKGK